MKKMKNVFLACAVSLGIGMLAPQVSQAIPSLGVAPTNGADYYGTSGGAYMDYFTTGMGYSYLPGSDGWALAGDGGLTVWADSALASAGANVFLVTNSLAGDNFTFDGVDFAFHASASQADGYDRVNVGGVLGYYYVDLGVAGTASDGWDPAPASSPFAGFYFNEGTIGNTSGFAIDGSEWLFAVADANNNGDWFENGKDQFSPKTTSTRGVPEPQAMLLFGTCLAGLAFVGKARKVK